MLLVFVAGLLKKLRTLSQQKDCEDLILWLQSIVNHLYWVAASTPGGEGDIMMAKWESLVHHIQNVHQDLPNDLVPACQHQQLEGAERNKQWLQPSELCLKKMNKNVLDHCSLKT